MDAKRYTVTVFSAAPGTWVHEVGYDGADHFSRSITSHVFFETDDGFHKKSWGFAPVEHGDVHGPGEPKEEDADEYIDPMYERTWRYPRTSSTG